MNDKQIAGLFISILQPAITANANTATVKLARNFQPRQAGATNDAYVYFVKIGDHRYGHTQRKDVFDVDEETFTHTELQVYESTYQLSAWVPQDPTNTSQLTESDILNEVSCIIQTDTVMAAFRTAGVGILRVTDIRNPYIVDDRDRFEAVPSFDVVLTHNRSIVTTNPAVVTYEANLSRI